MTPYLYIILRYVHDSGAGEALNIGVLLYAPQLAFLDGAFEHRYERLSSTFNGFDGDNYRHALNRARTALMTLQKEWSNAPLLLEKPERLQEVLTRLWADTGTSLQWSDALSGITDDPLEELTVLFDRMVRSRAPQGAEYLRRDDEMLWRRSYSRRLPDEIVRELRPKRFVTPSLDIEFDHALKNGAWHVLQPVSMDFSSPQTMQKRATQLLGTMVALRGVRDLAKVYFLLGAPGNRKYRKAYERAKRLLQETPVQHELIEEDGVSQLAEELSALGHSEE